ncbi:MAG: 6-hydroxymethylpterin diphosphokinase MptE-like protein [Desulfurococcaceae archaeon]
MVTIAQLKSGDLLAWFIDRNEWVKIYRYISSRLPGLNFEKDQEAADLLSSILLKTSKGMEAEYLFEKIAGREVTVVVGCGKNAYLELEYVKAHYHRRELLLVAADGAAGILLDAGLVPDVVATDLDAELRSLVESSSKGSILVVHAHGDNIDRLDYITAFKGPLIGSTQVEPRPLVYNFGGFTDGDRALFLLYCAGYRRAILVGFNFEKPHSCPGKVAGNPAIKSVKLGIARMLISLLRDKGMEVLTLGEVIGGPRH